MTDSEKIDLLLLQMQAMNERFDGADIQIQAMKERLGGVNIQMQAMNERLDGVELQIKSTERTLKNEIRKSESLILDEVERVHMILDEHIHDTNKHTA